MSASRPTLLEQVRAAIEAEASELERDADKSPAFIEGLRYGAAFVTALTVLVKPPTEPEQLTS